ncbi:MAG TPA: efflux RND transporter periplasmic adaptor subunit [Terriglobia bacterium]|nr:efflux RND transporter periplasmic adaptor subunit [Terriglobia bacterium]
MDRKDWTRTAGFTTDEENNPLREPAGKPPPRHDPRTGRVVGVIALVAAVVFAAALYSGLRHRQAVREELAAAIQDSARTPVSVIHPQPGAAQLSITFPANLQGYIETPIYARTNGYIKRWLVDIGAHVTTGQLLAEIETPELDQQLRQAEAAQAQAQANLDLARITAVRYQDLLKFDGISRQEVDQANGTLKADEANLNAAIATVNQLKELQAFEKVTAPFAGTITARYIDIGSLIAAGTNTLLFRLSVTSTLRVYSNVPEAYSPDITPGVSADVEVPEVAGKQFPGKVVRSAGAVDPTTRTMLTEVHVPNPTGALVPGEFGEVTFHLRSRRPTAVIPSNALLFRAQGPQVALVRGDSKVHLQSIKLGRDFGNSLEVLAGLTPEDSVIANPSDAITEGVLVDVQPSAEAQPTTGSQ